MVIILPRRRGGTWEGVPVALWCIEWICRMRGELVHHTITIPAALSLPLLRGACRSSCTHNISNDWFCTRISNFFQSPFFRLLESLQYFYTWLGAGRVHLCLRDFQNTSWWSGCSLKSFLHTFQTISDEATSIQDCNLPRPCSPIWEKWNGSFGQTPCPTCPTKIWRNPSPCPTCPTKIWKPPSPCPTCPTYSNLSQLVPFDCTTCPFPTLFSELFFWVSHWHSIFRKTLLNEKFVLSWTAMANIVASPTIAHISVLCSNQTYKLL